MDIVVTCKPHYNHQAKADSKYTKRKRRNVSKPLTSHQPQRKRAREGTGKLQTARKPLTKGPSVLTHQQLL